MRSLVLSLLLCAGLASASVAATSTPPPTAFDLALAQYEALRLALVADRWGASEAAAARRLRAEVEALAGDLSATRAGVAADELEVVESLLPEVARLAGELANAKGLRAARDAFHRLSQPLVRWHAATGRQGIAVTYCAMAQRAWLQPAAKPTGNPYYGQQMATCGEVVR